MLLEDIEIVVLNSIEKRCRNSLAKIYLTNFLLKAQEIINFKRKEFNQKWA